jgi:hypothetical protein
MVIATPTVTNVVTVQPEPVDASADCAGLKPVIAAAMAMLSADAARARLIFTRISLRWRGQQRTARIGMRLAGEQNGLVLLLSLVYYRAPLRESAFRPVVITVVRADRLRRSCLAAARASCSIWPNTARGFLVTISDVGANRSRWDVMIRTALTGHLDIEAARRQSVA